MRDRSLPSTMPEHTTVVNALRTVGHCSGSEVKNYINTVQFLTQTNRFMS